MSDKIGKFIRWGNGLRLFVIGPNAKYPNDFDVQYAIDHGTEHTFTATAANIEKGEVISEEEAKRQYATIQVDKPQRAVCSCGNWRLGRHNLSIIFALRDGKVPVDELYRMDRILRPFLGLHQLGLRLHPRPDGLEMELFSMKANQEDPKYTAEPKEQKGY